MLRTAQMLLLAMLFYVNFNTFLLPLVHVGHDE